MAASRAAVLGSPIAHSLSPVLHRAAYRALGLTDWSYEAIECDAAGLGPLIGSLGPDWAGLSLTMPLKRAVLPLLDTAEPLVSQVGAANTVVFADGAARGYNTDVPGMLSALGEAGPREIGAGGGSEVLILGSGATACSAIAALHQIGAERVVVAVRDEARAGLLLEVAGRLGISIQLTAFGAVLPTQHWPLLISTVPGGAADGFAGQISAGALTAGTVLDVVYHPWPTRLAASAELAGSRVISGFELLLHQAAGQVELMTGRPAPTPAMRTAGQAELARRASALLGGEGIITGSRGVLVNRQGPAGSSQPATKAIARPTASNGDSGSG